MKTKFKWVTRTCGTHHTFGPLTVVLTGRLLGAENWAVEFNGKVAKTGFHGVRSAIEWAEAKFPH